MFRMNGMPRAQGCVGAAKHIHVALILGFLPRTVLVTTTHPSVDNRGASTSETTHLLLCTAARVCSTFFQDLARQEVEKERTGMYSQRVLKEGTAWPRRPQRI